MIAIQIALLVAWLAAFVVAMAAAICVSVRQTDEAASSVRLEEGDTALHSEVQGLRKQLEAQEAQLQSKNRQLKHKDRQLDGARRVLLVKKQKMDEMDDQIGYLFQVIKENSYIYRHQQHKIEASLQCAEKALASKNQELALVRAERDQLCEDRDNWFRLELAVLRAETASLSSSSTTGNADAEQATDDVDTLD